MTLRWARQTGRVNIILGTLQAAVERTVCAHEHARLMPVIKFSPKNSDNISARMKMLHSTSYLGQPKAPPRRVGRAVARSAALLGIFVISLVVTLTVTHLEIDRFTNRAVSISELMRSGALWPAVAFAALLSILVGALLLLMMVHKRVEPKTERRQPATASPESEFDTSLTPTTRQILRLTRNAERLDNVERDLIRAIAHDGGVHPYTQRLLKEMRICTSRLLGELSDMDRLRRTAPEPDSQAEKPLTPAQM
jgi:hypothetical protein